MGSWAEAATPARHLRVDDTGLFKTFDKIGFRLVNMAAILPNSALIAGVRKIADIRSTMGNLFTAQKGFFQAWVMEW